jgi:hypothetical protein
LIALVYFIGFLSFTSFAPGIESLMLHRPIVLLAAGSVLLTMWWAILKKLKRDTQESEMELIYEDAAPKEVQTLDILGAG